MNEFYNKHFIKFKHRDGTLIDVNMAEVEGVGQHNYGTPDGRKLGFIQMKSGRLIEIIFDPVDPNQ